MVYDGSEKPATITSSKDGIGTIKVKYSTDGGSNWSDSVPKNVGEYLVGVTTEGATNYENITTPITVSTGDKKWGYSVTKATPTAEDFTFTAPENLVYDGSEKPATITSSKEGIGTIKVKYSTDGGSDWSDSVPKNVGEYLVGVTTEGATNYENITTPITVSTSDKKWGYSVTKATPTAEDFTFTAPENLVYDGSEKPATITSSKDGIGTIKVKYSTDGGSNWSDSVPKNVGEYLVGVTTEGATNYENITTPITVSTGDKKWGYSVTKATPTVDMFNFSASNSTYDGNSKSAQVTFNPNYDRSAPNVEHTGMGEIVVFFKHNEQDWTGVAPRDVGTYQVGIAIREGENYKEINGGISKNILTKNEWTFDIEKATPTADMFNFSASDSTYDGNAKEAQVTFNSNYDDMYHSGMGEITVHYYKNSDGTDEVLKENVKNVATYYVGITVGDGQNYSATGEGKVLTKDNWHFKIGKAQPVMDFVTIKGGTTGEEPQLQQTEDKKEIFYGRTLKDVKDILPKSNVGSFSFKDESKIMKPVGEQYVDLVFTPDDTENYDWTNVLGYDPSTEKLNLKLLTSIVVDKSGWGDKVNNNGAENFVDSQGSTSVEITGDGVYWVKEESKDADTGKTTSAWYGLDNSKGVFEKGSRFLVRWINKAENPEEWKKYHPMIDSEEVQSMPDRKKWIFIAEVIHPDGTRKYEKLEQAVPLYVQLGEDWDVDDVEAYFLAQGKDERLNKQYVGLMDCPEGKRNFFKLELLHFSPYTIYDVDPASKSGNTDGSTDVTPPKSNNIKDNGRDSTTNEDNSNDSENVYDEEEYDTKDIENKDDNQENNKGGINPWYFVAGFGLLGLSLLLGWLLYKKRKKEKDVLMYSILAQVGRSSANS